MAVDHFNGEPQRSNKPLLFTQWLIIKALLKGRSRQTPGKSMVSCIVHPLLLIPILHFNFLQSWPQMAFHGPVMHHNLMAPLQTRMLTFKHEYLQNESKTYRFWDSLPPQYIFHGNHSGTLTFPMQWSVAILISGLNCNRACSLSSIHEKYFSLLSNLEFT